MTRRGLSRSDAAENRDREPVALLAYEFWQERLAGDPPAFGNTLQLVSLVRRRRLSPAEPEGGSESFRINLPVLLLSVGVEIGLEPAKEF